MRKSECRILEIRNTLEERGQTANAFPSQRGRHSLRSQLSCFGFRSGLELRISEFNTHGHPPEPPPARCAHPVAARDGVRHFRRGYTWLDGDHGGDLDRAVHVLSAEAEHPSGPDSRAQ